MKSISLLLHLVTFSCMWSSPIASAVQTPGLTLDDVFQLAKSADPTVRKANAKMSEMSEKGSLARSGYFPALALQSTLFSNQLLFSQKIWDGGATQAASELASQEQKMAGWEKKSDIRRLHSQVTNAYFNALFSMKKVEILESDVKRVDQAVEYAEKQLKFRAIGRNTLLKARVAQRKNYSDLFEARSQKTRAAQILNRLTRKEDFSLSSLAGELDSRLLPPLPEFTDTQLIERASNQSAELHSLENREQAELARNNISMAEDRIQVSFVVSYGVGQTNPPKSIYPGYQQGLNLGGFINLPLFSGLSSASKKRISVERRVQINEDLTSTRSNLDFDIRELVNQLKQDSNDIATLDTEIRFSERIWDEVNSEYQMGLGSPDVWFDSITNLEAWKIQQLSKTRDYMIRQANLSAALNGSLND